LEQSEEAAAVAAVVSLAAALDRRRAGTPSPPPPPDERCSAAAAAASDDDGVRVSGRCRAAVPLLGGEDAAGSPGPGTLGAVESSVLAEWFDSSIGIDSSPSPRSPPTPTNLRSSVIVIIIYCPQVCKSRGLKTRS